MILDEAMKEMSTDIKEKRYKDCTLGHSDIKKSVITRKQELNGAVDEIVKKTKSVFCMCREGSKCSTVSNTAESLIRWRLEVRDDIGRSGCGGMARAKAYLEQIQERMGI